MSNVMKTILFLLIMTTWVLGTEIDCPDQAPVSTPVSIKYTIPEGAGHEIIISPVTPVDCVYNLFDEVGSPVTVYWSPVPGPKTIILITAINSTIDTATHILQYTGGPPPPPPLPEPTPEYKAKVAPLKAYSAAIGISDTDKTHLNQFYSDFASVISGTNIETNAAFQAAYIKAGKEFFSATGLKGKYAGLAEIIDKILATELGEPGPVPFNKAKAANILNAIAWSVSNV